MDYDFDSYFLYESTQRAALNIRFKINLKEPVDGRVLENSAKKSFLRFPYFQKRLSTDESGAFVLLKTDADIAVIKESRERMVLGSDKTNHLLLCITYKDRSISFHVSHSLCGGAGAMNFIKATLWQYLTDLYQVSISKEGIITPESPMPEGETALPDENAIPKTEVPLKSPQGNAYLPMEDFERYFADPVAGAVFTPIVFDAEEFMTYAREHDGSPNSILSAMMFKALARVFATSDVPFISASIVANYRADVGCPLTYHDLVRMLRVIYTMDMAEWSIKKLSTMTREMMFLQMKKELSWAAFKRLCAFRKEIDAVKTTVAKQKYAIEHSLIRTAPEDTYTISYVGLTSWGGLSDYVDSVYSITDGHLIQELNALPQRFCLAFQQVIDDDRYVKAFTAILDEEHLGYEAGRMEEKNLAAIDLSGNSI